MTFSFHPEARDEFDKAIEYYNDCDPGLGDDFSIEVLAAIQNIANYPTAWPVVEGDIRRCFVKRFPYGIIYSIERGEILIVAVMHLHRRPDYWKDRP